MIFSPYDYEAEVIHMISKICNSDYTLIRLTPTMIEKNNIDANTFLQELLLNHGLVDYSTLASGGNNGIVHTSKYIIAGKVMDVKLKFYKVANARGDQRFSLETIKRKRQDKDLNEGDLLYISIFKNINAQDQIFIVNLTSNVPSKSELLNAIGLDSTAKLLEEIKPKLKEILRGGYYSNSKGTGTFAPKDIGDTLEYLLGVETNNRNDADFYGLIELKSKGEHRTLDTLFTLRPSFEGTIVAMAEPNDRSRVSALTRMYGYESDNHPGYNSLYITIGSKEVPQNGIGFYLDVDDTNKKILLYHCEPFDDKPTLVAFWEFDVLKKALYDKHPSTLWFKATSKQVDTMMMFKYTHIEFSRSPKFMTFLSLVKKGIITYDWRGYTTKTGKYTGKNHGNAWRIKPEYKNELFGSIEKIDFN